MIEVVYPGRPVPWARVKRGKDGKAYTPKRQKEHRESLAWAFRAAAQGTCHANPVKLEVDFDYKAGETRIKVTELSLFHFRTSRPDIDNLVKEVAEALEASGVIEDDSQIAIILATKIK